MSQKGFIPIVYLLIIVILSVLILGGTYFLKNKAPNGVSSLVYTVNKNVLHNSYTFSGRVIDAATKQPISGVIISLNGQTITTGTDGKYNFTNIPINSQLKISPPRDYETPVININYLDSISFTIQKDIALSLTPLETLKKINNARINGDPETLYLYRLRLPSSREIRKDKWLEFERYIEQFSLSKAKNYPIVYGTTVDIPTLYSPYPNTIYKNVKVIKMSIYLTGKLTETNPIDIQVVYEYLFKSDGYWHILPDSELPLGASGSLADSTSQPRGNPVSTSSPSPAQEAEKVARDDQRYQDLHTFQTALNKLYMESTITDNLFCNGVSSQNLNCYGSTLTDSTKTDGNGWIKANLSKINNISLQSLPVDPLNNQDYHYAYCSNGKDWEIEARFESSQYSKKMASDGGPDSDKYEMGNSVFLFSNNQLCKY